MRVEELSVVVNFAGKVGVIFVGRLEDDLRLVSHIKRLRVLLYLLRAFEPLVSLCVAR
jgi:hypothetical protein